MKLKVNNVSHDIVNYVIPTHKLKFGTERKAVLIGDLHGYHNNKKKRDALIEAIRQLGPIHHISIAGDHMNASSGRWTKDKLYENFCDLIVELSKIAPVFLSQGNHDINAKGALQEEVNRRFLDLQNRNPGRIFPLINGSVRLDEFEIFGFTPSHDTIASLSTQTHGIARDKYFDEVNASGLKIENRPDVINEMVGHNPHNIGVGESDKDLGMLANLDVSKNGHWHNAYRKSKDTRANPRKYMSGNGFTERIIDRKHDGGIARISPLYGRVTSLARGITFIDNYSQQHYLQLRSDDDKSIQYFKNVALNKGKNIQEWEPVSIDEAEEDILNNHLIAVEVTGGVKKFSPIPRRDEAEIVVETYSGRGK